MTEKILLRLAIFLVWLILALPASATIPTSQSTVTLQGTGATTVFSFPFVADQASDLAVIYTSPAGAQTTLSPSSYTVTLNPIPTGGLWAIGGTVTYPLSGSPIAVGSSLTIQRNVPLLQTTVLSNQGNFYPQVVEQGLDVGVMQNQQLAARTGSIRGTWLPNTYYNYSDIVQDGTAGLASGNYYMATTANLSGVWATDLANGDWVLVIQSQIPAAPLPLSVANGGTGASSPTAALNNLGGIALSGNNAFTGANTFSGGSIAVPTAGSGDSTTKAASTAFVSTALASYAPLASPSFTGTATANQFSGPTIGVTNGSNAASGQVGYFVSNTVAIGSAVFLPTVTSTAITSISLPAGDWDVWGQVEFTGSTASVTYLQENIGLAAGSISDAQTGYGAQNLGGANIFQTFNSPGLTESLSPVRVNFTTTTPVYLNAYGNYSGGTLSAYGGIYARRVR